MDILLMIVFLVIFVVGSLTAITDVPTVGEAIQLVVVLVLSFVGIMVIRGW